MKKTSSWAVITVWLIIFFPIAIVLIMKKMRNERDNYVKNGKSLRVLGCILPGLALIYLIMLFGGQLSTVDGSGLITTFILLETVLVGGGALSIIRSDYYIKSGEKFERYLSIIKASGNNGVDYIAEAFPTPYDVAISDLKEMIKQGFIKNAFLDENKGQLVMANQSSNSNSGINSNDSDQSSYKTQRTVRCPGCGAVNKITEGKANKCEYCGTPL